MACAVSNLAGQVALVRMTGRGLVSTSVTSIFPAWKTGRFPQRRVASRLVRPMASSASTKKVNQDAVVENTKPDTQTSVSRPITRFESPLSLFDSWDPFSPSKTIRRMIDTMDRLFDMSFGGAPGSLQDMRRGARLPWDVMEDEESFNLRVDIPGYGKDEVKVAVEDGVLVIKGERKSEEKEDKWTSRSYGEFSTRLALPDNAKLEEIKAELKNGVLSVRLPKVVKREKKQVIDVAVE